MSKSLYTVVPINMDEFIQGKNPTTQPGQIFPFFASMNQALRGSHLTPTYQYNEYYNTDEIDENFGYCILKFQQNAVSLRALSQQNAYHNAVGEGNIPPSGLTLAIIMQPSPDGFSMCHEIEDGDFEALRQEFLEAKHADFKSLISWEPKEWFDVSMSPLAYHIISSCHENITSEERQRAAEIYHSTSGPEAQKILCALTSITQNPHQAITAFDTHKEYYVNHDEEEYDALHGTVADACITYASWRLAWLPDNLRDVATRICNEKFWELSDNTRATWNTERHAATATAYAIEYVLPSVQRQSPELLEQVLSLGKEAMETAIQYGATKEEMMVAEDEVLLTDGQYDDIGDDFGELD